MDHRIKFFDINVGKEVKKIDINQNSSTNSNQYQQVTLSRGEYMTHIQFCADGCTIAVGTNAGRIVVYNLKDVKKSKLQLQFQTGRAVSSLAFPRPIKSAAKQSAASNVSASNMSVNKSALNQSVMSGGSAAINRKGSQGALPRPGSASRPTGLPVATNSAKPPEHKIPASIQQFGLQTKTAVDLRRSPKNNVNSNADTFKQKLTELKAQTNSMLNRNTTKPDDETT